MINRCTRPKSLGYRYYGGRGITVCSRWYLFENFIKDMGKKPSLKHEIDRKNNKGNYGPGNCRWVTRKENARNKSSNVILDYKGEKRCMKEWAEVFGLNDGVIRTRIFKYGWSVENALETPSLSHFESARRSCMSRNKKPSSSGLIGVLWNKDSQKWMARIRFHGQSYYLGLFEDPLEAALVRDAVALYFHGDLAVLNK